MSWLNVFFSYIPFFIVTILLKRYGFNFYRIVFFSGIRTIVQLIFLYFILDKLFKGDQFIVLLCVASFMVMVASYTVFKRIESYSFSNLKWIIFVSIFSSVLLVGSYSICVVFKNADMFALQRTIPIVGLIIGNSLTGVSIALDCFLTDIFRKKNEIEQHLSFGATVWEALHPHFSRGMKMGLQPITNSMLTVGLVSIPGMMSGQLIAGEAPETAALFQMSILSMIFMSTLISIFFSLFLVLKSTMDVKKNCYASFVTIGGE